MTEENREDLESLLSKLNAAALNAVPGSEEMANILKQVGTVTDRIAVLDKQEDEARAKDAELELKAEDQNVRVKELDLKEREVAIKEADVNPKFNKTMRVVEIVVPLAALGLEAIIKTKWTKMVCRWEKDETFRSTAGRQISGLFKWKW